MVNIGNIIIQKAREQGTSIEKLAPKLNLTKQGLYKILHRDDIKISRILQLSQALNHDFLQYYRTGPVSLPEDYHQLKHENKQLKQTIETLQRENNLLNDFVQVLKSQSKQS